MKTLILLLFLNFHATAETPSPRLDKLFLNAHAIRDDIAKSLSDDLKPFCDHLQALNSIELGKVSLYAIESCEIESVLQGLDASENELSLTNGQPFLMSIAGSRSEAAAWRYFIRTQKAHRLLQSLREYFSHSAGINRWRVNLIGIPKFAGALDNFSYWSRLIAMKDNADCTNTSLALCQTMQAPLDSLALLASDSAKRPAGNFVLGKNQALIADMANTIRARISGMTLAELTRLENMQEVTSAGLGIPYFRQLVSHVGIEGVNLSEDEQRKLRNAILLNEIQEAIERWHLPQNSIAVDPQAVKLLADELQLFVYIPGGV